MYSCLRLCVGYGWRSVAALNPDSRGQHFYKQSVSGLTERADNKGLNAAIAGGDARQASRVHGRWAEGLTRRGGLTFELWQQKGSRKAVLPSSIVRKTTSFPHGLAPWALAVWPH